MNIELYLQGPSVYMPILFASLIVAMVVFGIFPLTFVKGCKKPITRVRYNTYCYLVNFLLLVVFIFLNILLNGEPASGGAYIVWTHIFVGIGIKKLKNKGMLKEHHLDEYELVAKKSQLTKKSQLKGNLCLLLAAIIWGSTFVAQSAGTDIVDPFTFLASRSFVGFAFLIPVILFMDAMKKKDGKTENMGKKEKKRLLTGGIACGVVLCAASAFQQFGMWLDASAGDAGFITALYILIVPVAGLFFGKKVGIKVWLGVVIALIGLYLLTERFAFTKGTWMVLICAFVFSAHIMVVDYFSPKVDGVRLSCIQFFTVGVLATVLMFIFEKPDAALIKSALFPIVYSGVMSSGIAYTLQIVGQKYTEPTVASMLMSLESVFALLFGMLIQPDENPFKLIKIMGCVAIFGAIILAQLPERRKNDD